MAGFRVVDGTGFHPFYDKELDNYVKLLTGYNIPFDVACVSDIRDTDTTCRDKRDYSTVIITLPARAISDEATSVLRSMSRCGTSILASFNRVDSRMQDVFGIKTIMGRKITFPCTVHLREEAKDVLALRRGISFWRLQARQGGLKKQLRKFIEQVFMYMRVEASASSRTLAIVDKKYPAIIANQYGEGVNYYISLHHNSYLNGINGMHKAIKDIILKNSGNGFVHFDLKGAMALRMDDPGSCERVYLKHYDTRLLDQTAWEDLSRWLKRRNACLSVMYVPCWIDDGNETRGDLFCKGMNVEPRVGGTIFDSRDVRYVRKDKSQIYDYNMEFRGVKWAYESAYLDIESHGLTHTEIDSEEWLKSKRRYRSQKWFREFRHEYRNQDVGWPDQASRMTMAAKKIEAFFGKSPTTITPASHIKSSNTEDVAKAVGFRMVSCDVNTLIRQDFMVVNDKLMSVFIEAFRPTSMFAESGYPFVGVFHDYDIVKQGVGWLDKVTGRWRGKGVTRLISLRELVGYLFSSIVAYNRGDQIAFTVDISDTGGVSAHWNSRYFANESMNINVRIPDTKFPTKVLVNGRPQKDFVLNQDSGELVVTLPPFHKKTCQQVLVRLRDNTGGTGVASREFL